MSLWTLLKILFYTVTATKGGLLTDNLIGHKKYIRWGDILEIKKPSFGIPRDARYVITSDNKLILLRSMTNYELLIQLIKEKAPNLEDCSS